ncbi:hypothetical protein WUBG_13798 [Wuchereria bancrofti]|uniref:Trehalase n=1 Tax=Wuchereria bancrofti TaxID=6293 RepID=J9EE49_WUCBA|nr:hypothetical protein WUBG_13798 [Wuchereria bancrofti]
MNSKSVQLAYRLARKWILGNFKVFRETGYMWEKYDVNGTVSQPGGGGEYFVQDGFGWSNGVILDLLTTYYDRMRIDSEDLALNNSDSATLSASERISSKSTISLISIFYTYLLMR